MFGKVNHFLILKPLLCLHSLETLFRAFETQAFSWSSPLLEWYSVFQVINIECWIPSGKRYPFISQ